jgi:hypothetical protein
VRDLCQKRVVSSPDSDEAWIALAWSCFAMASLSESDEEWNLALMHLRNVESAAQNKPTVIAAMSECFLQLGNSKSAEEILGQNSDAAEILRARFSFLKKKMFSFYLQFFQQSSFASVSRKDARMSSSLRTNSCKMWSGRSHSHNLSGRNVGNLFERKRRCSSRALFENDSVREHETPVFFFSQLYIKTCSNVANSVASASRSRSCQKGRRSKGEDGWEMTFPVLKKKNQIEAANLPDFREHFGGNFVLGHLALRCGAMKAG